MTASQWTARAAPRGAAYTAPPAPPDDGGAPPERPRARARILAWLAPVAVLGVLALAFVVLHRELGAHRYADVAGAVGDVPGARLLRALLLTALAYACLPGYDALALRYAGRTLPLRRVGFGSFVTYGLSQTLGFPALTGSAVRYRFWSAWGLSAPEIAQAAAFSGGTFTLGVLAVGGTALLLEARATLAPLGVPAVAARVVGALCLTTVAAYLAWSARRRGQPVRVRGWSFPVPPPALALAQLAVAALDWTVAAAVPWALLPPGAGISFVAFLGVFVLAQYAGLASHVPGGLGVFEMLMLLLLPGVPPDALLGVLLVYRAVYYLLPFALAVAALAAYEAHRRRARLREALGRARTGARRVGGAMGRFGPAVLPTALSAVTFAAGAVLLFSGATPSVHPRLTALDEALPLGVIEASHLLGSLAGAGLLVLALGIRRRLDAAHALTVVVLSLGIVASLLKGLDWEEATVLAAVLAVVAPSRRAFYRKAALTAEPFTPSWVAAVVAVVGVTVWLGLFSFRHVEYSHELWWRFAPHGDAPRFLRATVLAGGALVTFALAHLLRPSPPEPALPDAAQLARAEAVARAARESIAHLALLGDKPLLFSESGRSFIQYGLAGRSWVALGDPVGAPEERAELAWRFREEADRHGGWTVFYEVPASSLPLYIDLGLTFLKLGEQARVPLGGCTDEGALRRWQRRALREVEREGATFEVVPRERVPALLPALREVSDAWLAGKRAREKGFSLGRFDEAYLARGPVALVRAPAPDGAMRPVAFANLWLGGGKQELSPDLMRFAPDAPAGMMDYLFTRLLLWGHAQGYQWFDLGMAPLAGMEARHLAPSWARAGAWLYRYGEHFYNFQGLRAYKEKFDPEWEPRYLASPGGLALPRVLANVASLIAGGVMGVVAK